MKLEEIKTFWNDLNQNITVNKRELVLGIAACTLAGVVVGILLSPNKTMTIGSHNGSNNSGINLPSPQDEVCPEEENED